MHLQFWLIRHITELKYHADTGRSVIMIKKLNLLVLMLLTISINTLYAEERIIIIGERTTNNSIICGMGACRDFLDSLNQGVANTFPSFEGEDGGGGAPKDEEDKKRKAKCNKQARDTFSNCTAIVASGAAVGLGYCTGLLLTGPGAGVCAVIVAGATALNAKMCNDMNSEMVYQCDLMP